VLLARADDYQISSLRKLTYAVIMAFCAEYLNDPNLAVTFFAPTNAAWEKRISTLTKQNDISVYDLFSEGRSPALAELLKYHILQGFRTVRILPIPVLSADARNFTDVPQISPNLTSTFCSTLPFSRLASSIFKKSSSIIYSII
jgi:hypothetical protein